MSGSCQLLVVCSVVILGCGNVICSQKWLQITIRNQGLPPPRINWPSRNRRKPLKMDVKYDMIWYDMKPVDEIQRITNSFEIYSLAKWIWRNFYLKCEIMKLCLLLENLCNFMKSININACYKLSYPLVTIQDTNSASGNLCLCKCYKKVGQTDEQTNWQTNDK